MNYQLSMIWNKCNIMTFEIRNKWFIFVSWGIVCQCRSMYSFVPEKNEKYKARLLNELEIKTIIWPLTFLWKKKKKKEGNYDNEKELRLYFDHENV